jgi:hypothetical protein
MAFAPPELPGASTPLSSRPVPVRPQPEHLPQPWADRARPPPGIRSRARARRHAGAAGVEVTVGQVGLAPGTELDGNGWSSSSPPELGGGRRARGRSF